MALYLLLLDNSFYNCLGFHTDFLEFALSPMVTVNKSSFGGKIPSVTSINPYFITGFTDAEGCFLISVRKVSDTRTGWKVDLSFQINLHSKDIGILKLIQDYFGGIGAIHYNEKRNSVNLMVGSLEDIYNVIIPHFRQICLD